MRVRSPLADIDLQIGSIAREEDHLVVRTAEGTGIPTRIDIDARDAARILKTVLCSRHALAFIFQLPLLYWRARKKPRIPPSDIENPWS